MDELVNAVQLALADSEIYDEVLRFSTVDNVSCYVDTNSEANYQRIITKPNPDGVDQYTFLSDARQLDETPYFAAGNMRGVTITFAPNKGSNGSIYDLKQGVINQYVQISGNQRFGAMPKLYNRVRSSVGDEIFNTSQTYRNSEYTVFIVMGTIGGNDESAQDATRFYGQWSGTNLPAKVSYQLVTDRIVGDTGNQIVEIDDDQWNETNGNKVTINPGDLNGGGSFDQTTNTGNQKVAYAIYSETDKSLSFYKNEDIVNNGDIYKNKKVTKVFMNIEEYDQTYGSAVPWYSYRRAIQSVHVIDEISPINTAYWFYYFKNCKIFELDNLNTENVHDMQHMFDSAGYDATEFKLNLSNFETKNVTDMNYMFFSAGYNSTEWDVGNLSGWNVSNVTNAELAFCKAGYSATNFNLNLSNWKFSKEIDMSSMFANAGRVSTTFNLNLSGWNIMNKANMDYMFQYAGRNTKNFKINLYNWKIKNETTMNYMFNKAGYSANTFNLSGIANWNTENVTWMAEMFCDAGYTASYYLNLSNWNVDNVLNHNAFCTGVTSKIKQPNWKDL